MSDFLDAAGRAAGAAVCGWLNSGGSAAITPWIIKGVKTPGTRLPSVAAGLGLLALHYGCSFDPNTAVPPTGPQLTGCKKSSGHLRLEQIRNGSVVTFNENVKEITSWSTTTDRQDCDPNNSPGTTAFRVSFKCIGWPNPDTGNYRGCFAAHQEGDTYKSIVKDGTCIEQLEPNVGPLPPVTYTDIVTNCTYNMELLAFEQTEAGNVRPVIKMSSVQTLAGGGVIGGCNFPPFVYHGPGGGNEDPYVYPWNPGPDVDGEEWWVPLLRGAVSGAVSAAVGALLDKLFPQELPAVTYRLTGVCEVNAQGEPISRAVERAIPALPYGEAIDARLGAIVDIAQGLKDFKQPVCAGGSSSGEPVTVHFVSTEVSPNGTRPLRKELRYRDQSLADVCVHANHWAGFSWNSGPVQVMSQGLPWGKVQVWASTADEGKRVIRHAAQVAGVDLTDPRHSWSVNTAKNPRYGVSLTMVPAMLNQWNIAVSKRDGPSGPPQYPSPA